MRFHFAGIALVYLGTMPKAQIGGLRIPVVELNVHCSGRPNSFYRRNSFVEGGALPSGYARNLEHCLPLENKRIIMSDFKYFGRYNRLFLIFMSFDNSMASSLYNQT